MYIHTQSPYISSSSGPILPFFSPVHDEQKGSRSLRVGVDLSEADPCATYLPLLGEARVGLGGGSDFGRLEIFAKTLENLGALIFFQKISS